MYEFLVPVAIGAFAGVVRSVLGWVNSQEEFAHGKLAKSVVRSIVVGILTTLAIGEGVPPVALFFTALGGDVVWKEGYAAVRGAMK